MSQIEQLALHNRDLIWHSCAGPIPLKRMSADHLRCAVQVLEWQIRKNKSYHATHPCRRHETHREYQLANMKAELEWRNRNGL